MDLGFEISVQRELEMVTLGDKDIRTSHSPQASAWGAQRQYRLLNCFNGVLFQPVSAINR
jgi:hypothetical protein